jgi:2,3-bisphosphoglycerate-dependent phosphoglycerate mutase
VPERYEQRPFAVPPDATEVVMVRHGASQAAVPGEPFEMLEGHADPALSEVGGQQALRVADRLAGEPLTALFTTALVRTRQTAAPLAARLGLEPVAVPELNEVHLGEWEAGEFRIRGHQRDPLYVRALVEERWDVVPGAESNEGFAERVRRGMERVLEAAGTGVSVGAFLHGGVIGEVCRQATSSRPFAFIHADNCSISRLVVFADGRWLLRSFNDTAHLA